MAKWRSIKLNHWLAECLKDKQQISIVQDKMIKIGVLFEMKNKVNVGKTEKRKALCILIETCKCLGHQGFGNFLTSERKTKW